MKSPLLRVGRAAAGAVLLVSLLSPSRAAADFYYYFDHSFSGASPSLPSPWITEFFHDVSPGTVNLTITASDLASTEFMSELYINLNPSKAPTSLAFSMLGSSGSFTLPSISKGVDSFKADGDGKYDVKFSFGTADGTRFTAGDSITYQITVITGLVAMDFDYLSAPAGGSGPFLSATHIQGITNCTDTSGWANPNVLTPVPEPAPVALFGLALGLWAGTRRFFARAKKV